MSEYAKINGIDAADIAKIDGIEKASAAKVLGLDTPSASGATLWAFGMKSSGSSSYYHIGRAAASDLTSWTIERAIADADISGTASDETYRICYGLDGSGNPRWVTCAATGNPEVRYGVVTDSGVSGWGTVNMNNRIRSIAYSEYSGSHVWMAIGHMGSSTKYAFRSTDGGESWSTIDLSSVANMGTQNIYRIATDGAGTFVFGQQNRVYASTDGGQNWEQIASYPGIAIADLCYTTVSGAGVWFFLEGNGSVCDVHSVNASDITTEAGGGSAATWRTSDIIDGNGDTIVTYQNSSRCAAANGIAIVHNTSNSFAWTLSTSAAPAVLGTKTLIGTSGHAQCISGSPDGTWLIGEKGNSAGGKIHRSTDNGANWAEVAASLERDNAKEIEDIAPDVVLPF